VDVRLLHLNKPVSEKADEI